MKTLLRIDYDKETNSLECEFTQSEELIGFLLMGINHLQRKNLNFRAIVSAAFEFICEEHPDAFEHLKECLAKKEITQATIHVTPNPTKS